MKHVLLVQSINTRVLIVLISIVAFFAVALLHPASSQAAPPSAPPPTPKSPTGPFKFFMPQASVASKPPSKKGVGMPYPDCTDAATVGATWEYMWGPQPPDCPGIDNVPMLWGAGQVNATITGNSQWVMGFNEPDQPDQSNISAANAAVMWQQIEQNYPNRKLVAPAPSQLHPNWLVDFRNAYIAKYGKPPRLDALAMHCYMATAADCMELAQTFESWAQAWGVKEIWLTEFAFLPCLSGSDAQAIAEGQTLISWVENQPLYTRMAWFASRIQGTESWAMSCNTPLLDWTTRSQSTYGKMYAAYR